MSRRCGMAADVGPSAADVSALRIHLIHILCTNHWTMTFHVLTAMYTVVTGYTKHNRFGINLKVRHLHLLYVRSHLNLRRRGRTSFYGKAEGRRFGWKGLVIKGTFR